jgi:hypothetical protein
MTDCGIARFIIDVDIDEAQGFELAKLVRNDPDCCYAPVIIKAPIILN